MFLSGLQKTYLLLALATALVLPENAGGQEMRREKSSFSMRKKARKKPFDSKFGGSITATYSSPFKSDSSPSASLGFAANYQYAESQSLYLSQEFGKRFEIEPGQDEIDVRDSLLGYSYGLPFKIIKTTWKLESSVPASRQSQYNGLITATTTKLGLSRSFFDDNFTLGLTPFARVYFNEYKTRPVNEEGDGGEPLSLYQYGSSLSMEVNLKTFWALGAAGSYSRIEYENTIYTNDDELEKENPPTHHYMVTAYTRLALNDRISATLGMVQASQVEKHGGIEFVAFDDHVTQWYGSLTLSL